MRLRLPRGATIVAVRTSYYSTTPPAVRTAPALSMPPLPRPPQPRHRMVLAAIAVIAVIELNILG